ncbi:MAG: hypothetical protein KKE96_06555, partial [Candidatus Altiarchaeota archaeon]|nr:hypothetical protein [Candidatus Altiarchaeota archaeon]
MVCPTTYGNTWSKYTDPAGAYIECTGSANPAHNKKIVPGESDAVSFKATSAPSENAYQWDVYTEDNNWDSQTNNPITTVDDTKPTVSTVTSDGATYNTGTASPVAITVTFSEDVSNTPTINVDGVQTVTDCDDGDATTFCFGYAVPASTEAIKTITISDANDLASNVMDVDNTHTFDVDTVRPEVTTVDSDGQIFKAGTHTITVTFSEDVKDTPAPQ